MCTTAEYDDCDKYAESVCDQICVDSEKGKPFQCACHQNYYLSDNYKDCIFNMSFSTAPLKELRRLLGRVLEPCEN